MPNTDDFKRFLHAYCIGLMVLRPHTSSLYHSDDVGVDTSLEEWNCCNEMKSALTNWNRLRRPLEYRSPARATFAMLPFRKEFRGRTGLDEDFAASARSDNATFTSNTVSRRRNVRTALLEPPFEKLGVKVLSANGNERQLCYQNIWSRLRNDT